MALTFENHAARAEKAINAARAAPDVMRERMKELVEGKAGAESVDLLALMDFFTVITSDPTAFFNSLASGGGVLIDTLVQKVTGLTVTAGTVETALRSSSSEASRLSLGLIFTKLLEETLKLDEVRTGFANRNPGTGEGQNMARMVGAAFRMQIGDMLADWVGKAIPYGLGAAFSQIAERVDKAINLDDAIEEIIQVPMQAVITRGLEAYYNRELKPIDLTNSEAYRARIAGKITPEQLEKTLDNSGIMDDVRQIQMDFAASNLTESDINEAYQHNLLSREEVKEQYKQKFFQEPDRELKTKLVEGTRRWKLQEKVFELYGNLYRDGVATREEIKPFLDNFGYDPDEQEMWFNVQELERRQRKWISDSNLIKLVTAGTYNVSQAVQYLEIQGMSPEDALTLLTLALKEEKQGKAESIERKAKATIAKLPKAVRDKCQDIFSPEKILSELLAEVVGLIPLGGINLADLTELADIIECALKAISSTPVPPPTP